MTISANVARRFLATTRTLMQPHPIRTAAMLVIGDEILNGKIKDTNSQYFADFCFRSGIDLRRISVVPDERDDIVDVLNGLRARYDFIVTSGGIGPTHDDITYESIAAAFGLGVAIDQKTVDRMNALSEHPPRAKPAGSKELEAQLRMALFPTGTNVVAHYVAPDLWVPVVALDHRVYVFPGVPILFTRMLEALLPVVSDRLDAPRLSRRYVSTTTLESELAPVLTELQQAHAPDGIKIGSYPHLSEKRNTISIIGPADNEALLQSLVKQLEARIHGHEISVEEEKAHG